MQVPGYGQSNWQLNGRTVGAVTTSEDLPFWFHSNRAGEYDPSGSNLLLGLRLDKKLRNSRFFDYGIGTNFVGRGSLNSDVFFNELYAEAKIGILHLYSGKKNWQDGIWSSELSLGSMIWSGNSATMPKVMAFIPEYTSVPFTNGWIAFRGYWGHGWFGKNRYVEDTYLHEKALYVRLLQDKFPVNGHLGLIHNVQWGGTHPRLGDLPDGTGDYWRIVTGRAGESGTSPEGEVLNALGNTLGAYEARLDIYLNNVDLKAYRQFFIETGPNVRFRSPWDGQWGLQVNIKGKTSGWLKTFLWEHLNTKRQNAKSGEAIGADNYYNNFIYQNGWTYKDRIIGSPLIGLGTVNERKKIVNNIIVAHHFGFEGTPPIGFGNNLIEYQLKVTYSRNYGLTTDCSGDFCDEDDPNPYRTPRRDQWYYQLELGQQITPRFKVTTTFGLDVGELSDEFGVMIGASYSIYGSD
ncbi:capsule assembly Wzi family protein [Fodinibius sp. N2]|uniref:capsule assembly Wzi family protein n=1 Tax=Fodinibius alkaliphilus TaxID=3140241 RepID=UPI003159DBF7